jgi:hypothetical protein
MKTGNGIAIAGIWIGIGIVTFSGQQIPYLSYCAMISTIAVCVSSFLSDFFSN